MPNFDIEMKQTTKTKTRKPSMYRVILYNSRTSFEFIHRILIDIFKKSEEDAIRIAQEAHNTQKTIVGVYVKDVAETRVKISKQIAADRKTPLLIEAKPI